MGAKTNIEDSGVYVMKFKGSFKIYIGSTIKFRKRFNDHKSYLKRGSHYNNYVQNMYNKYKEPIFEILECCNKEVLLEREQYYYDLYNPELNIVSDITRGGVGHHTAETIIKLTKIARERAKDEEWLKKVSKGWFKKGQKRILTEEQIEELRERASKIFKGKKHTVLSRKKMSESAKNRGITSDLTKWNKAGAEASKKPVIKKTKDGIEIEIYKSITDAISQFNTKQTRHLVACCNGLKDTYKGYKWEYI